MGRYKEELASAMDVFEQFVLRFGYTVAFEAINQWVQDVRDRYLHEPDPTGEAKDISDKIKKDKSKWN